MKRFPRYSLLTWIEAIVNMAHTGAALLALVFLILGLSLLAWFSTVAKVFLVLSLILITVQIVSRIRFIRTLCTYPARPRRNRNLSSTIEQMAPGEQHQTDSQKGVFAC